MTKEIPKPLDRQPFSIATGLTIGLTEAQLRRPGLSKPFWGVRTAAEMTQLDELADAWMTRMPGHAFFSHTTAAQLWQIPLPLVLEQLRPIHVSVPGDLRGPTGRGTRGHHLAIDTRDLRTLRGRPVTSLERTVFDLAATLNDEALLAALDNILWRKRLDGVRATHRSLAEAFLRFRGRRGRSRLIELMLLATHLADSPPESAFRLRFLRAGFPLCLPNEPIFDSLGRQVAIPDLQFPEYRMAFDYEGEIHRVDKAQWRKDIARVRRIQNAGWHYTRISGDDLDDSDEVLGDTRRVLVERGWRS